MQKKVLLERNGHLEFFRQREVEKLERDLGNQEYVLVSSAPHSGLSIFLRQASEHMLQVSDLADYEPLFVSATDWEDSLFVYLATQIAEKFLKTVKSQKSRLRRFQNIEKKKGLEALFKSAFGRSSKKVVIFMDEFHLLSLEKQKFFVTQIRQLHTYRSNSAFLSRIHFVIGGNLQWKQIDPDQTSPFSNAASKLLLDDLNKGESFFLIQNLLRRKGLAPQNILVEYIYELTLGHPYFIQVLSKILASTGTSILTFQMVDQSAHRLIEEGDRHLREMRESLLSFSEQERTPLLHILQGKVLRRSLMVPNPKIEKLLLLGILKVTADNRLHIRNPIYSKFLRKDPLLKTVFFSSSIAPHDLIRYTLVAANKKGYTLLHKMEIKIRNFIVNSLYCEFQEQWKLKGLHKIQTEPERDKINNKTVKNLDEVLELRQVKERSDPFLSHSQDPILSYATLKELELIVIKNWRGIFKARMGAQDRFKVYLTSLNRIRNKLAHNRKITDQEINKLKEIEISFKKWMGEEV